MSTTNRAVFGGLAKTQEDRGPITVELRGEVRLEVGGSRVEGRLPGRLGRALLAFLVAAAGAGVAAAGAGVAAAAARIAAAARRGLWIEHRRLRAQRDQ